MKKMMSLWVYLAVVASAGAAHAEGEAPPGAAGAPASRVAPADRFRSAGTAVLDDIASGSLDGVAFSVGWLTYQSSSSEANGQRSSSTLLGFVPSADAFVVDGLSFGGAAGITRSVSRMELPAGGIPPTSEIRTTTRTIAPRVGYAFRLTDDLLFWPRVRFGVGSTESEASQGMAGVGALGGIGTLGGTPASQGQSGWTWSVGGDASFVFVLGRHAAISAGPQLGYTRSKIDDPRAVAAMTNLGVRAGLRLAF